MNDEAQQLVREVFDACRRLSEMTGRPVSPDGHLVGTIGEVIAAEMFGLTLMTPSNGGYDAIDGADCKVEIKATTRRSVSLSASGTDAERLIVLQLDQSGMADVAYDGPSRPVWDAAGPRQKTGQRRISLSTLRRIAESAADPASR